MKAIVKVSLWKAIALLTAVLFFSCTACNEPVVPQLKPIVDVQKVESVTATTAIIVASVVANEDNAVVSVMYRISNDATWVTYISSEKFSGDKSITVNLPLKDLQPGTKYDYKVTAKSIVGSVETTLNQFATEGLIKATAVIKPVINLKINSVTLVALITANQDPSSVAFEFKPSASTDWNSQSLSKTYSGNDSTLVSLDLTGLLVNANYDYRVKVINKAGEVTSTINSFKTYAVVDADGNYYHTVTIGNQTWLQENLKTTHYLNGDPIANLKDTTAWKTTTTGDYAYYNNDPELGKTYGALYNWYVTSDSRGLVSGYHVPSGAEFATLQNFLGWRNSGIDLMEAGNSHWLYPRGTNPYGFTALPIGEYGPSDVTGAVKFMNLGLVATFWANDSLGNSSCIAEINPSAFALLNFGDMKLKYFGFGIRLLKD